MSRDTKILAPMELEEFQRRTNAVMDEVCALMRSTGLGYVILQVALNLDDEPMLDVVTNMPDARPAAALFLSYDREDAQVDQILDAPNRN